MVAPGCRTRPVGAPRALLQAGVDPEVRQLAHQRAAELGLSLSLYIQKLIQEDGEGGVLGTSPQGHQEAMLVSP